MPEIACASRYPHLVEVNSSDELLQTPTQGEQNLVLLQRNVPINFQPLADKLANNFSLFRPNFHLTIQPKSIEETLRSVDPTGEEDTAIAFILQDIATLSVKGNVFLDITNRTKPENVFHVDGQTNIFVERILCSYTSATTECIAADDVVQSHVREHERIAKPGTQKYFIPRAALAKFACAPHTNAEPFPHKPPTQYRVNHNNSNRLLLVMDIYE